jgi:LAS superfamily LD-carboxypeptidase LdcB
MNAMELTGRTRSHIQQNESPRFAAEKSTMEAFFAMRDEAAIEGFDLIPLSAFRDFHSQLRIWNLKYSGQRPLYNENGVEREYASLSPEKLQDSILAWSALPGGSRHHWGTDIDVIDGAVLPAGSQVQLLPEESEKGGIFYELHCWLDKNLERFGFFRPYDRYRGGINGEPWHVSFKPVSHQALADLEIEMIRDAVLESEIMGKEQVLASLPDIFQKYILNISR